MPLFVVPFGVLLASLPCTAFAQLATKAPKSIGDQVEDIEEENRTAIWIGIGIAAAVLLLAILACVLCCLLKRCNAKKRGRTMAPAGASVPYSLTEPAAHDPYAQSSATAFSQSGPAYPQAYAVPVQPQYTAPPVHGYTTTQPRMHPL